MTRGGKDKELNEKIGGDPNVTTIYGDLYIEHVHTGGENHREYPIFIQSWYADEFSMAGAQTHLKSDIICIETVGPVHGLFIEPEKSQFVWDP